MRFLTFWVSLQVLIFTFGVSCAGSTPKVKEVLFKTAVGWYEKGNYVGSLEIFETLEGYKNSTAYLKRLKRFFLSPAIYNSKREPYVRILVRRDVSSFVVVCESKTERVLKAGLKVKVEANCSVKAGGYRLTFPRSGFASLKKIGNSTVLVVYLPLEVYLQGVLRGEVYPSWPSGALKAQAVAARTYALFNMVRRRDKPYDVTNTVLFQHFAGLRDIPPSIRKAVKKTRGEVMLYKSSLIYAMYHSNDGGRTFSFKKLLGLNLSYLSDANTYKVCNISKLKWSFWMVRLNPARWREFLTFLGLDPSKTRAVLLKDGGTDLVKTLVLETPGGKVNLPFPFFVRLKLHLPSAVITDWDADRGGFRVGGKGFGHLLGMSQWGAYCLASKGWDYKRILRFYYRGIELKKLY